MSRQKSILGETRIPSISMEQRHDPSVQARSRSLQCVLEQPEHATEPRGNSCNIVTCFSCSLLKYPRAKLNQRRCSLKCVPQSWTHRFPVEKHHQFLFLLGHGGAPTQVRDTEFQSMSFEVFIDKNVSPSSFFTWNK